VASIDEILRDARRDLIRVTPAQAVEAQRAGALLIDTRTPSHRLTQGEIPGALVIDRTVLEWRLDPTCAFRIPEAVPGTRVVVLCRHGYSSSLAAHSLRRLDIDATDVIGGVQAWISDGLPIVAGPADVRE
jgi:rhodanese-related sulfurtransferase